MSEKVYRGALTILYKRMDADIYFLVVQNTKSGNFTFVGGAQEDMDTSIEHCAEREIQEEVGLSRDQYKLQSTGLKNEFVFGPNKSERLGHKGSYDVFLGDATGVEEVPYTKDVKSIQWLTKQEVLNVLTFQDLKNLFVEAIKLI